MSMFSPIMIRGLGVSSKLRRNPVRSALRIGVSAMGIVVLLLLVFGSYWLFSGSWYPHRVPGTPATGTHPATPPHFEWNRQLISWQSVPGAILVLLGLWFLWIWVVTPAVLRANQTYFRSSGPQWSYSTAIGDKVGNFVLDQDGKDFAQEVAKEVHEDRHPNATNFTFVPQSIRFVIRKVYSPGSLITLNVYEVESILTGKATWEEEEVDAAGKKSVSKKEDAAFTLRGREDFDASELESFLFDYGFVRASRSGDNLTASPGKRYVNQLFTGMVKAK